MEKNRVTKKDDLIASYLKNKVFSCASIAYSRWYEGYYQRFSKSYGLSSFKTVEIELKDDHFFDLASLTKPLSTVLVLLSFFEKKKIWPSTEIGEIFEECPESKKKITISHLMSHKSGLPAHREYFQTLLNIPMEQRKKKILESILNEELKKQRQNVGHYSDLGFILLGLIMEKISGRDLGYLAQSLIYSPLGLENSLFYPGLKRVEGRTYVDTERCIWDKTELSGRVHDDNCRALGGICGHAGLFGTSFGVMRLCEKLLDQWMDRGEHPSYSNDILRWAFKKKVNSNWAMGFDTVSKEGSSSGRYFSSKSVGHLGFTGTSFWIDPEKQCIAVLLSNRVCYGNDNLKIREARPKIHDILMAEHI